MMAAANDPGERGASRAARWLLAPPSCGDQLPARVPRAAPRRSSLRLPLSQRRPTPGARPARRTSSVVAALAALAPRLVRLAHHGHPDRLLSRWTAGTTSP